MESLFLLVPLSVALVFVALWVFFKASDSGQFDDLVGPGMRILQDDDSAVPAESGDAPLQPPGVAPAAAAPAATAPAATTAPAMMRKSAQASASKSK